MNWQFLIAFLWGFISFALGGWWERRLMRKSMPYIWSCLVPGCGFSIKASHTDIIMELADKHEEFGHGE